MSKQLPTIVTWGLSYLFLIRSMAAGGDVYADQGGMLGNELRMLSSAVSHVFLAFGDVITLHRRVLELSGYTARIAGKG